MKIQKPRAPDWFINRENGYGKTHVFALNPRKGFVTTLCGIEILYLAHFPDKKYRCKKCEKSLRKQNTDKGKL